jgi:hypothetical protein
VHTLLIGLPSLSLPLYTILNSTDTLKIFFI